MIFGARECCLIAQNFLAMNQNGLGETKGDAASMGMLSRLSMLLGTILYVILLPSMVGLSKLHQKNNKNTPPVKISRCCGRLCLLRGCGRPLRTGCHSHLQPIGSVDGRSRSHAHTLRRASQSKRKPTQQHSKCNTGLQKRKLVPNAFACTTPKGDECKVRHHLVGVEVAPQQFWLVPLPSLVCVEGCVCWGVCVRNKGLPTQGFKRTQ